MGLEMFLLTYIVLIFSAILVEIYLLKNDRITYMKENCKSIKHICDEYKEENIECLNREIERYYLEYTQEKPRAKKYFKNIVSWLDFIILRIDSDDKYARDLVEYSRKIKAIRDSLELKNPYNKCEKYQQGILCDMQKIKTTDNEIIVQNIVSRTEEEFLRLSSEIKKNSLQNTISIMIGVIGIIVSILMAFVQL